MTGNTLGAVALASLLPLQALAANVNISINPSATTIMAGGISFVDLVGTYDGSDRLLGGAIGLNFRADLLEVLSVTLRAPSDVAGTTGTVVISGANGTVSGIGFATFVGVTGTFDLATIGFRALGPVGNSLLTAFDPGDPIYAWVNEGFETVSVTSTPAMIAVSAVPEPSTLAVWLAGLGAIAAKKRWRFATKFG